MRKTADPVATVFAAAARAIRPTPTPPLDVALLRIAVLERRVEYLTKRVALLVRMVDLLADADGDA